MVDTDQNYLVSHSLSFAFNDASGGARRLKS